MNSMEQALTDAYSNHANATAGRIQAEKQQADKLAVFAIDQSGVNEKQCALADDQLAAAKRREAAAQLKLELAKKAHDEAVTQARATEIDRLRDFTALPNVLARHKSDFDELTELDAKIAPIIERLRAASAEQSSACDTLYQLVEDAGADKHIEAHNRPRITLDTLAECSSIYVTIARDAAKQGHNKTEAFVHSVRASDYPSGPSRVFQAVQRVAK